MFWFVWLFLAWGAPGEDLLKVRNDDLKEETHKVLFVALSEVSIDGKKGTSEALNALVASYASVCEGSLKHRLSSLMAPDWYRGNIFIYDQNNISHLSANNCNYISDSLACGVKNNHWTLRTYVVVGKKYSTLYMRMYDEKGVNIGTSTETIMGLVRYHPQWKITKVDQDTPRGKKSTKITEIYPPKMEELPPLITGYHIQQSIMKLYLSLK